MKITKKRKEIEFPSKLFQEYAIDLQRELELMKTLSLENFEQWEIDWDLAILTTESPQKRKPWKKIGIIETLLEHRNKPAIYYFSVDTKFAESIFNQYQLIKKPASRDKIDKGIGHVGYFSFSYVPRVFKPGPYIYVGSRKEELHGRLIQHLGLAKKGRTGALYLYQVLRSLKVIPPITFHYTILDPKYKNLTKHIECVIQDILQPFIGKRAIELGNPCVNGTETSIKPHPAVDFEF